MNPSLAQTSAFIRQLTHDLRNDLSGIELEAALLATVSPEGEAAEIAGRLRAQVHGIAIKLQQLAVRFTEPRLGRTPVLARVFFEMLRQQFASEGLRITWTETLGQARVNVDTPSLFGVFQELFDNAATFGDGSPLAVSAAMDSGKVMYSLREPKLAIVEPEEWGRAPFVSTKRGRFGLGLWEADRVVRANGGSVARSFENGHLITTLSFPLE